MIIGGIRFSTRAVLLSLVSVALSLIAVSCAGPGQTASIQKSTDRKDSCDVDRTRYGRAKNLSFWCELTDFERMALEGARKAREGDPEALFALAVFASGDVRDTGTYGRYRATIHDFVESVQDTLGKIPASYDKGKVLYEKMCGHFFRHKYGSDEMKGYEFAQSRITGIFQTARYNCVSSALLYTILARFVGLEVSAVVLPSHVFVQIDLPNAKKVEVETTVHTGYDVVHDKKYYENEKNWFGSRRLNRSTYDDYRRRWIITPFHEVCRNMGNQHTDVQRMGQEDRNRLCEAQGFLAPDDTLCVNNRLIIFRNEFLDMLKCRHFSAMQRMFSIVAPIIPHIRERWKSDPVILTRCAEIELHYAHAFFLNGRPDSAISVIDGLLSSRRLTPKGNESIRLVALSMIHDAIEVMLEQERYDDCVTLLKKVESIPFVYDSLPTFYGYFYNSWGSRLMDKNRHREAIDCFQKALEHVKTGPFCSTARENIAAASLNCAGELWDKQEWGLVMSRCSTALAHTEDAERKRAVRGNMCMAMCNWATLHLERKAWGEALAKDSCALYYADTDESRKKIGDLRFAIYANWGVALAEQEDFEAALEKYRQALGAAKDPKDLRLVQSNVQVLYSRWALSLERKKDIAGAKLIVEQCIRECPEPDECYKVKRTLAGY